MNNPPQTEDKVYKFWKNPLKPKRILLFYVEYIK